MPTTPRRLSVFTGCAVVVVLLSSGLALSARAAAPLSGRDVALGLEAACADRSDTFYTLGPDQRTVVGRWITVVGPTFGLAPGEPRRGLVSHAVDPVDPQRSVVSDGQSIQLSRDGGCSWEERHFRTSTYPEVEVGSELTLTDSIRQLEFAGRGDDRRAYALIATGESDIGAVRVLVSDNAGVDWVERSAGLPQAYTRYDTSAFKCPNGPCPTAVMATSPTDSGTAYLAVSRSVGPSIFATQDGGRTWAAHQGPTPVFGSSIQELVVNPGDPSDVWGIFADQMARSSDGGQSWEAAPVMGVAGLHLSSGTDGLHVQAMGRADFYDPFTELVRSRDGGQTFTAMPLARPLRGVPYIAQGGSPDDIVMSTDLPNRAWRFDPTARSFVDIRATGLDEVSDPQTDATAQPVHWFRQFASLAVYVPGPAPTRDFAPPKVFPFPTISGAGGGRVPGELDPATLELELGPEGSREMSYRLDLPALATPVDIWFLMDTSGSMAGAINGLRDGIQRIIGELAASGLDAWFGLATFPAQNAIYDRQADIAPPNPEFYAALDRLDTDGMTAEVHPTALYQSVTGAGQEDAGIPPGRGATFRQEALKIIVHATDEAYGFDPAGPTQEQAAAALLAAGVRHVGLDLAAGAADPGAGADAGGLRSSKRDHDAMAIATGTLAPAGGIDCNGDGMNELEEGDPVTCPIVRGRDNLEIAPAIISAVRAVRDETAVALTVADQGGIRVEVADPTRSPVNLKTPNALPFSVRYTCPAEMTGKTGTVSLRATVRGVRSAESVARVGCGVVHPAATVPPPPTRAARALVPMILAPPQVVPDLEPGVSPLNQTAPAQVGQPGAQTGLAAQPGEPATAKQRAGRDGPPTGQSSDGEQRSQRTDAPEVAATLGAGAALSVALGGWAVRRERRVALARA